MQGRDQPATGKEPDLGWVSCSGVSGFSQGETQALRGRRAMAVCARESAPHGQGGRSLGEHAEGLQPQEVLGSRGRKAKFGCRRAQAAGLC